MCLLRAHVQPTNPPCRIGLSPTSGGIKRFTAERKRSLSSSRMLTLAARFWLASNVRHVPLSLTVYLTFCHYSVHCSESPCCQLHGNHHGHSLLRRKGAPICRLFRYGRSVDDGLCTPPNRRRKDFNDRFLAEGRPIESHPSFTR